MKVYYPKENTIMIKQNINKIIYQEDSSKYKKEKQKPQN